MTVLFLYARPTACTPFSTVLYSPESRLPPDSPIACPPFISPSLSFFVAVPRPFASPLSLLSLPSAFPAHDIVLPSLPPLPSAFSPSRATLATPSSPLHLVLPRASSPLPPSSPYLHLLLLSRLSAFLPLRHPHPFSPRPRPSSPHPHPPDPRSLSLAPPPALRAAVLPPRAVSSSSFRPRASPPLPSPLRVSLHLPLLPHRAAAFSAASSLPFSSPRAPLRAPLRLVPVLSPTPPSTSSSPSIHLLRVSPQTLIPSPAAYTFASASSALRLVLAPSCLRACPAVVRGAERRAGVENGAGAERWRKAAEGPSVRA
ncbi:hypothetical protein DFH09DRAFT_274615 [Mycena vulgaris]|nr:hypothetical protein DFH09DRAFT_274615 [Mycena vulgaris]